MRVLICGGRNFGNERFKDGHRDRLLFAKTMADLDLEFGFTLVINGAARGADRMGSDWAHKMKLPAMEFPAAWTAFGKGAGAVRNSWMLRWGQPQLVVAFPGGPGTADMVKQARAAGVRVIEVTRTDATGN